MCFVYPWKKMGCKTIRDLIFTGSSQVAFQDNRHVSNVTVLGNNIVRDYWPAVYSSFQWRFFCVKVIRDKISAGIHLE